MIAMPLLVLFVSFPESIFLINVLSIFFGLYQLPKVYRYVNKKVLSFVLAGSFFGLLLGVWSLTVVSEETLQLVLLGVLFLGIVLMFARWKLSESLGGIAGVIGGFFSGSVGVSGPVYASYIDSQLKSRASRASLIVMFLVVDTMKLPLLLFGTSVSFSDISVALYAIPVVLVAMLVGNYVERFIPDKYHHTLVIGIVCVSAALMIIY
jgi:uncharacterized membrane protein YfcA